MQLFSPKNNFYVLENNKILPKKMREEKETIQFHFFLMTWNIIKVRPFGPSLRSKPQIHDLICHNHVSSNLGKFLVEIEHKISGSTTHPKPPTSRQHLDGSHVRIIIK